MRTYPKARNSTTDNHCIHCRSCTTYRASHFEKQHRNQVKKFRTENTVQLSPGKTSSKISNWFELIARGTCLPGDNSGRARKNESHTEPTHFSHFAESLDDRGLNIGNYGVIEREEKGRRKYGQHNQYPLFQKVRQYYQSSKDKQELT